LLALASKRRLDAADVTLFVKENSDVDVAAARKGVAERVGLLTAELEQERTAASEEARAVPQDAPEEPSPPSSSLRRLLTPFLPPSDLK
jgi:hypothetical protein